MHFPVIINGLDCLHSSVSSLAGEPEGRTLKYAVLHLQFAAETLFKARLELHDAALVWVKPEKFDERLHRQGDFKSVGTKDALERLRETVKIANPIDPDDGALKALVDLRNRITCPLGEAIRWILQGRVHPHTGPAGTVWGTAPAYVDLAAARAHGWRRMPTPPRAPGPPNGPADLPPRVPQTSRRVLPEASSCPDSPRLLRWCRPNRGSRVHCQVVCLITPIVMQLWPMERVSQREAPVRFAGEERPSGSGNASTSRSTVRRLTDTRKQFGHAGTGPSGERKADCGQRRPQTLSPPAIPAGQPWQLFGEGPPAALRHCMAPLPLRRALRKCFGGGAVAHSKSWG
ncbi:hypothetical protein ACFZA1_41645 [Streptomyces filipinensis]|uniref:hypothetical protein n=1 Tax=Streptomyces filipinensis TaxID=66887 RepID=UPI0036E420D8